MAKRCTSYVILLLLFTLGVVMVVGDKCEEYLGICEAIDACKSKCSKMHQGGHGICKPNGAMNHCLCYYDCEICEKGLGVLGNCNHIQCNSDCAAKYPGKGAIGENKPLSKSCSSSPSEAEAEVEAPHNLILCLPDDIALNCLARIPRSHHPTVSRASTFQWYTLHQTPKPLICHLSSIPTPAEVLDPTAICWEHVPNPTKGLGKIKGFNIGRDVWEELKGLEKGLPRPLPDFSALESLQELNLGDNPFTSPVLDSLLGLKSLKVVNLINKLFQRAVLDFGFGVEVDLNLSDDSNSFCLLVAGSVIQRWRFCFLF
ncbi:hypothetical protein Fmac_008212 [Flemingia macrophylla]|uniref:Defensin-like protein n=1 Tax=Flemingia macrophylla TaxID=520843 RepID=A0ABD1MWR5_9FABA